jgi:hypothetical protein
VARRSLYSRLRFLRELRPGNQKLNLKGFFAEMESPFSSPSGKAQDFLRPSGDKPLVQVSAATASATAMLSGASSAFSSPSGSRPKPDKIRLLRGPSKGIRFRTKGISRSLGYQTIDLPTPFAQLFSI